MRPDHSRRDAGFTLLEVLVAFTIAALALGVMFEAVLGGLRATQNADTYQEALSLARSHIAAVALADLRAREQQGDDGHGFHWRLRIVAAGTVTLPRNPNDDPQTAITLQATLYGISVVESWKVGDGNREVRLDTERIAPGKPKA